MRHNYLTSLILIVAFVLLLQIGCQDQAKAPEQPTTSLLKSEPIDKEKTETTLQTNQSVPEIMFEKVLHDFGEIPPRKKQIGEFKFTNTGSSSLKITDVKKCCGVIAKLDKEELAPGESGILKVEYSSGSSAGTMSKKLYVSSNDKINPKVELAIKAKIVPKVAYEPKRIKLLVKGENAGCPEIMLTSLDNQPFAINGIKSTRDSITADIDSSIEATKFVLKPEVDFEKLQNSYGGTVRINLSHPECEMVSIFFNILKRFQSKPGSLMISNADSQRPLVKKISVLSNYDEDFEIESVSSKNDFIKVLNQEKISNGYELDLEINLPNTIEKNSFRDMLYVNIKDHKRLQIVCYELRKRKHLSSEKTGEFKNVVKATVSKQ